MNLNRIVEEEVYNHSQYLSWKRKNVTIRGMKEIGNENGGAARFGSGLYTAFLSNREMSKQYGKVYFVVGAIPKKPAVVNTALQAEDWLYYKLIIPYLKNKGLGQDTRKFYDNTDIKTEMLNNGYDGLVIKGREMVNYSPDEDEIRYFENENRLIQYYMFVNDIR